MAIESYVPENLVNPCGGSCVVWAAPDLGCVPCAFSWSPDEFKLWLPAVNQMAFEDFGSRFPGCCCYTRIRICRPCSCDCSCGCARSAVDLWPTLRYPAIEIVDTGEASGSQWEIHQNRYLVPKHGVWPSSYDFTLVIKYGQAPPPLALRARDEELMRMMAANCGQVEGCTIAEGTVSLSENGRTRTFDLDRQTTLYQRARARWEIGPERFSMTDPADGAGISLPLVETLPLGDFVPANNPDCRNSDQQIDDLFAANEAAQTGAPNDGPSMQIDPLTGIPI